jgi:hypothetical protein
MNMAIVALAHMHSHSFYILERIFFITPEKGAFWEIWKVETLWQELLEN